MICAGGEAEIGNERERERRRKDTNMQVSCSLSLSLSAYLRGITECILKLALPPEEFSNHLVCGLSQDLLAEQVLLPTAHYVSTSFYFNSTVIALVSRVMILPFNVCQPFISPDYFNFHSLIFIIFICRLRILR